MRDVDQAIGEALAVEERELLRRMGEEPGFFGLAFGMFGGKLGWVNVILMVVQGLAFLAGVYAAWMFFAATEPVAQLRWGLPAAVLLLISLIVKMGMWPNVHADRLMRELKMIELQLARRD
jgi:hypothetical protein